MGDDDNYNDDDENDQNGHKLANFQARTSMFCIVVDNYYDVDNDNDYDDDEKLKWP